MIDLIIEGLISALANHPMVLLLFTILGTLLVLASAIDALLPDETDKGFSKKLFELPIVGSVFKALIRFSVLRNKKQGD